MSPWRRWFRSHATAYRPGTGRCRPDVCCRSSLTPGLKGTWLRRRGRPLVLPLATRTPRGDLLDQPQIAVGIGEGAERPVAGALGIDAGLPGLGGEWRAVPHVTHVDAPAGELAMGR